MVGRNHAGDRHEHFTYDTASGALYARAGSLQLLVATLTGHPTLAAGDITFVS